MRSNTTVTPGQLWQASDPRRLRLVRVTAAHTDAIAVEVLYPPVRPGQRSLLLMSKRPFLQTGPKGYMRIK